jgi:hypothetical protein
MVDTLVLGTSGASRGGSSPSASTKRKEARDAKASRAFSFGAFTMAETRERFSPNKRDEKVGGRGSPAPKGWAAAETGLQVERASARTGRRVPLRAPKKVDF